MQYYPYKACPWNIRGKPRYSHAKHARNAEAEIVLVYSEVASTAQRSNAPKLGIYKTPLFCLIIPQYITHPSFFIDDTTHDKQQVRQTVEIFS